VHLTETKQKNITKIQRKYKMIKNCKDIWDGKGTFRWKKLHANTLDSKLIV